MWNCNELIALEYQAEYRYFVRFDDGLEGVVDFVHYTTRSGVFAPLKEQTFFASAFIDGGTVAWPNGLDIAPERVYELLETSKNSAA